LVVGMAYRKDAKAPATMEFIAAAKSFKSKLVKGPG